MTICDRSACVARRTLGVGACLLQAWGCAAGETAAAAPARPTDADRVIVYVGAYTHGGKSQGIYRFQFDLATGEASPPALAAACENPSFIAIHPSGRFLYATNEVGTIEGESAGGVSAFAIDPASGDLTALNRQSSKGQFPCHVAVDRAGRNVLVANYKSGNVAVLPIREDGGLGPAACAVQHRGAGPNARRQDGPHAHSINVDASDRFAFAADLGADRVFVYRLDAGRGTIEPNDPPSVAAAPGAGPRHLAFHPTGRFAYVINELDSTVAAYRFDAARGALEPIQTLSTLPEGGAAGNLTSEVLVTPDGKFLYGSNRGHDSLAIFAIDGSTGKLAPAGRVPTGGKNPRGFGIDPTGRWLLAANLSSDAIVPFRIDATTGGLTPAGKAVPVSKPTCVRMVAARR